MCLGIPGKVVEIRDDGAMRMATIDYGGARKEACLAYVPEVGLGDYVIVHVGFAISQLDEEEALRTLELLRMIDEEGMAMELGSAAGNGGGGALTAPAAGSAPPPGAS
ncbi:MAG TPA: HypC/HybG/HupF family hydrogenase formation chaperone [Candidatus Limnocylindrales bacterium]